MMKEHLVFPNKIKCVIFDFAMTLCSEYYFKTPHPMQPSWFQIIQNHVFTDKVLLSRWCSGKINSWEIAKFLAGYMNLPTDEIHSTMIMGCKNLKMNKAVIDFAMFQKKSSRKTALVTVNMDVFTSTVVPDHDLASVFDTIINSADYHNENKEDLWQIAFKQLDSDISYKNSLLIDDSQKMISIYRANGGMGYEYKDDISFTRWFEENHLNC